MVCTFWLLYGLTSGEREDSECEEFVSSAPLRWDHQGLLHQVMWSFSCSSATLFRLTAPLHFPSDVGVAPHCYQPTIFINIFLLISSLITHLNVLSLFFPAKVHGHPDGHTASALGFYSSWSDFSILIRALILHLESFKFIRKSKRI